MEFAGLRKDGISSEKKLYLLVLYLKVSERLVMGKVLKIFLNGRTAVKLYGSLITSPLQRKEKFYVGPGLMGMKGMKSTIGKKTTE